jgi:chemotaxis protein MotB
MSKPDRHHHGGAWKTAYADFVTAMMALFLLLWLTAQDKKIKQAVERAFRNPFSAVNKESVGIIPSKDASATHKEQGNHDSVSAIEMQMLRKITEDLAKMLQQSQQLEQAVQINLTPTGLRINIFDHSQNPIFQSDTDKFTTYGAWVFSTLAWEISRYQTFSIELEGHTDTRPPSNPENKIKWDLSTERANAARRELVQNGVLPDQIYKVSGFADTQPLPGLAPTAESNNRVTVLVKVDKSAQPETSEQAAASPPATDPP